MGVERTKARGGGCGEHSRLKNPKRPDNWMQCVILDWVKEEKKIALENNKKVIGKIWIWILHSIKLLYQLLNVWAWWRYRGFVGERPSS